MSPYASSIVVIASLCVSYTEGFAHPSLGLKSTLTRFTQVALSGSDVDVSDLGLTMEDLNKPLPQELLQGISSTGYESTNRLPSVEDDGCQWTESPEDVSVRLRIPGLRGQPAAAASVLFSTTTISVSFFGRVVWSAILRGTVDPENCQFEAQEGPDMIPTIDLKVAKAADTDRWGGFILQVGEDSLI